MEIWNWYWDGILGTVLGYLPFLNSVPYGETGAKIAATLVLLFLLWMLITEVRVRFSEARRRREAKGMERSAEGTRQVLGDEGVPEAKSYSKAQLQEVERGIKVLKKNKDFAGAANRYASIGKFKDAAKMYKKAGDMKQCGLSWAKAGNTVYAARLLMKAGHYAEAGEFFAQKNKYKQAAEAYEKMGDSARAAENYARSGKVDEAVAGFEQYFSQNAGTPEELLAAAGRCHDLINEPKVQKKLSKPDRNKLVNLLGRQFAAGGRQEQALAMFQESGDAAGAGQIYLKMGRLEEAAQCMKRAGKEKEAAEIGGRFYESKGRWKEAAMAYEGAQNFKRAGDCWSKADQAERAAACYEQGGEFFGAGFARLHIRDWPKAIAMLQKVNESHARYSESRALLGRAFYKMKDYERCEATLDNYLTGDKVTSDNVDYYWMLALACEQLGNLAKSKEVLLKIQSVNMGYRDVSQRLSNIQTRISLAPQAGPAGAGLSSSANTQQGGAVMSMVAQSLGDRFELDQELGRGGMGVVYKATDKQLDRPVALKFLGSLVDGNEEYKMRFVREARSAAKVQHPNIVSIYDIGSDEGKAYIAMEFVDGPNLSRYLATKGRLDPREAINILVQATGALEAVHEAGIIHRDIKPDNILMAKGGLVKLMDFGLARGDDMRLTASRVVMGTPCYMSPEQCKGEEVDGRADIYALGLVLHELLTGRTVFAEGDALKRQVTEVPDPPSKNAPSIPEDLDALVMKAIAKDRNDRFASATEFIEALRALKK